MDSRPGRQPARRAGVDLGEFLHAEAVFQRQAVRIEEIEEHGIRRRMTAGPEHDRHVVLLHPPQRLADVVDVGDHEVHVVQMVGLAVAETQRMVQPVRKAAHEGHRAVDMVGGAEVQRFEEEFLSRCVVADAEHDVAQPFDLRHGRRIGISGGLERVEIFEGRAGVRLGDRNASWTPSLVQSSTPTSTIAMPSDR